MKANNSQSGFDKTKFSFNSKKKHALSDFNNTNLRETLSVFSFNHNNGEKISNAINIKLGEKEEYEFPSIKTMQKELIQKIFTKESGEIINIIKKVNDEMKVIPNANKTENQFHKTSLVNPNQNNTASPFCCMSNPNKISIEDTKGEIIAIRKKHPSEITHTKNKILINNKQLSHFNNLKPLNNQSNIFHPNHNNNLNELNGLNHNLNNNAIDNLNQTKSFFNESNNNFSTKNLNYNTNYNNSFIRSKSTSNNFFSPHDKKNRMGYSSQEDDQTLYVTQSVRNGLQGIPEHLERKYNMSSKNSVTWNAIKKNFNKRNQGFYCPHCDHCNNIQDENLEKYFAMKEAKNIIRKGFDYICEYFENDQSFLDFLINNNINNTNNNSNSNLNLNNSGSDFNLNNKDKGLNKNYVNNKKNSENNLVRDNSNISNGFGAHNYNYQNNSLNNQNPNLSKKNRSPKKNILMGELANSHFPKGQNNQNYNMNIVNGELENIKNNKKSPKFDLENLLQTYPKLSNDRNVLQLVTHFLDALINDKISLDHMVTPEIFEKLKESLIAQGLAFRANDNELEFDKEISMLFDEATKEKIKKLFKTKFKQMKKIENERKLQQEEELLEIRKRFMVLFLY